jgi:hypothetical protein
MIYSILAAWPQVCLTIYGILGPLELLNVGTDTERLA